MRVNHYQHTGDHPSVRCVMLKYAGASVLQLSVTGGTLEMKSKCPCFSFGTKERDISTVLRPVFRPLLVSAGLTFLPPTDCRSVLFSLAVWTLTCQKKGERRKKRTILTASFFFFFTDLHLTRAKFEQTFCLEEFERERGREKRGERGHNSDHMFNVTLIILN